MNLDILEFSSMEIADLATYIPPQREFAIPIEFAVRSNTSNYGSDHSWSIRIVSFDYLRGKETLPILGHGQVIVDEYDWPLIENFLRSLVASVSGQNERELFINMWRVAIGEFAYWDLPADSFP